MRARIKRFTHALTLPSAHDCIGWWEVRRLLYNLIVMPVFALSVGLSLLWLGKTTLEQMLTRPALAVVTMAVVFFVMANLGYTIGWASEILWTGGETSITRPYRKLMFWVGTTASVLLCLVPLLGVVFLFLIGAVS